MPVCATCGNTYDKTFAVTTADGETFHFDAFECAIEKLAPRCAVCGTRIIGHGLEADGAFYCCDHCAQRAGVENLRDRV
ncbi:MAG TPA: hypothetical protein VD962_02495 [Rubricoccaceae bacterium]|nr:hypothetical protein [Rubricoccaceae bacterium]